MVATLRGRIAIVHMKDFRLNLVGNGYVLPGPLEGEMNYSLFLKEVLIVPVGVPLIAEHVVPSHFADTRSRLLAVAMSADR
jgi:hypothetical protein